MARAEPLERSRVTTPTRATAPIQKSMRTRGLPLSDSALASMSLPPRGPLSHGAGTLGRRGTEHDSIYTLRCGSGGECKRRLMGVRRCPAVDYPAAVQRLLDAAGAAGGGRVRAGEGGASPGGGVVPHPGVSA